MRIFVKILLGLTLFLISSVAGVFALPQWPALQDRFGAAPYQAWLKDNRVDIALADPNPIKDLDASVYEARFIILSEIHGYRAVQAIDLAMVRHFAQTGPARTYLAELGPEQAMAFNHFLATGDDAPARAVFDAWAEGAYQWANTEFFQKLVAIRTFNDSLPADRKIWFVGVDQMSSPDQFRSLVAATPTTANPGFESYDAIQTLNVQLGQIALARPEDASRYAHILPNIEHLSSLDPERHFYGLWGLFHGTKTTVNGAEPLALRLNRDGGSFENSVMTFTTLCLDGCENMMPARAMPSFLHGDSNPDYLYIPMSFDDALLQRIRGANDIHASMGDAEIAAFKVTGQDSPYHLSPRLSELTGYLSMVQSFEYGGPAAELTDYFIAIRGSAGLTPWRGSVHSISGQSDQIGIAEVADFLNQPSP
jgi:hypothetical protein